MRSTELETAMRLVRRPGVKVHELECVNLLEYAEVNLRNPVFRKEFSKVVQTENIRTWAIWIRAVIKQRC